MLRTLQKQNWNKLTTNEGVAAASFATRATASTALAPIVNLKRWLQEKMSTSVNSGPIQDRFGVDLKSIFAVDSGSIRSRFGIDSGSIWVRFGIDLGSIQD